MEERLNPRSVGMRLQCPECRDMTALECQITCVGEGIWVSLLSQTCECDPYHAWEDVWEEARDRVREGDCLD